MTTEIIVHIKGLISDFSTDKMAKFAKLICKPKAIKCKPSDLQLTKVLHFQSDMYTFCTKYSRHERVVQGHARTVLLLVGPMRLL